eukprot:TRINITY_DN9353_c0_g1_i1.p3 TRINITY_DN9353_c0_g1~~TRINITY_DN9353_c0_g1_i1.p3  ORF type:complete len:102 (+),score=35.00 TRINITY_DN9353_c0_g1_i1:541-846(+)
MEESFEEREGEKELEVEGEVDVEAGGEEREGEILIHLFSPEVGRYVRANGNGRLFADVAEEELNFLCLFKIVLLEHNKFAIYSTHWKKFLSRGKTYPRTLR